MFSACLKTAHTSDLIFMKCNVFHSFFIVGFFPVYNWFYTVFGRADLIFLRCLFQGERLSHAVGCAFAACLERKQKREKECGVTATFDANRTTFTREGSFRVTTATEAAEREEVMRQLQDAKNGL